MEERKYEKDFKDVFKKVGVIWRNYKKANIDGKDVMREYFTFAIDGSEKKTFMYKNNKKTASGPSYILKEYIDGAETEVGAVWEKENGSLSIKVGLDKYSAYKNKFKDKPAYIVYMRKDEEKKEKEEDGYVEYNEEVVSCEDGNEEDSEDVFFKKAGEMLFEDEDEEQGSYQ